MSKVEDFKNAPVGATATHSLGSRAMKIDEGVQRWITPSGNYFSDEGMVNWGYTLDSPAPTSAREALDLAWELAHPVKNGQVIPKGTQYLGNTGSGVKEYIAPFDIKIGFHSEPERRTLEPLPEPEPDWLNAPAVLANEPGTGKRGVFIPTDKDTGKHWAVVFSALSYPWQELTDVTPLYPLNGGTLNGTTAPLPKGQDA